MVLRNGHNFDDNMKKLIFTVFSIFFVLIFWQVGAQNYYDNTFSLGYYDNPTAFVADSAENVYSCGWYEDENNQTKKGFVIKTDNNGEELWRVTMDVPSEFYALCITHTGSVAVAGSRNNRCFMTALNVDNGEELWQYEEEGSDDYWFATAQEVLDSNEYKLHTVKTKSGPHRIWYYLLDPETGNYLGGYKDVINTILGTTYTSTLMTPELVWTAGDLDSYDGLVVGDNFGQWIGFYWDFSAEHIAGVQKFSENRGCVVDYFPWGSEQWLQVLTMRYNVSGVYGNAFKIEHDRFIVSGSGIIKNDKILVTGAVERQLALWFINHKLTFMEEKIIPTENPRTGIDVIGLPSKDMLVMGREETEYGSDLFLMKLNYFGLVSTQYNVEPCKIMVYPNPATDKIRIKNNGNDFKNAKAIILNSMGKIIKTFTNINEPMSVQNLSSGLYVILITDENNVVYRGKFIK
jgi:hypothetical protein